ncbi:glutamate--cysteine ligase [Pantoea sp. Mhis]|uniref:glutamate--cysteine ligase n=1 Tax=Pantoea sp. Mhis TaxID=2576759 RepID=UPI001357ACB7|nr:glutamate--cysteine ligase [Pantoea sp. Mhis]MXP56705.1 glutamate--cysteine ligase [Pantoea sp. Mhis]
MIPDVSKGLSWLKAHPNILKGINRGIERETLRINLDGRLAQTIHPKFFGSPLTHNWITTDFAETLLEFITPVYQDIDKMLVFLRDIHRYVARFLVEERMWPFSMPCTIDDVEHIQLAQYGNSNLGKMKTLYRRGLKNRYGSLMQIISGVHYNFSLPLNFWQQWENIKDDESSKIIISNGYLRLIRNYYRFGWIIPYLFGSSPAICSSFLQEREIKLPFERNKYGTYWLPYATSLRLSDLGYASKVQSSLNITFNSLESYLSILKEAIKTPLKKYVIMGTKDLKGNWLQLNTNILQIENELYSPIRPKRISLLGETPLEALLRGGIEYIEIRSLDINPFSAIGVNADQLRFIDLFLIWCTIADNKEMTVDELLCIRKNWNRVVLEGRKPGQIITIGCNATEYMLVDVGKALFIDLRKSAEILDKHQGDTQYQRICDKLVMLFDNPDLTNSARILQLLKKNSMTNIGLAFAQQYHQQLSTEQPEIITIDNFNKQVNKSLIAQQTLELNDQIDFDNYLVKY